MKIVDTMPQLLQKIIQFTPTIHHDTYPAIDPTTVNLAGKSVLITGASRGLGKSTAISFASAGISQIAITARRISDLDPVEALIVDAATAAGKPVPKVVKVDTEVVDGVSVAKLAETVEKEFGKLDILINNAGVLETFTPIVESDADAWWQTWEVNVKGTYLVTRAFLPLMLKGGEKIIVNLSSIGAHLTANGASGYQTTKLAVLRFTEFIDVEYSEKGILAFAAHPGGVLTDMGLRLPKATQSNLVDKPELCGDTLVWLTKQRREWLAGRYVSVTWDVEELEGMKDAIVTGDKLKVRLVV